LKQTQGKTMSHYNPDPGKNISLTIDGIPVTVPEGTRILEAARKVNVHIPTLCDHPDLCKRAVCRLCVVECDGRGKLAAACANDVWEGVNIVTHNDRITGIRKMIIELLLANHPQECLNCIRSKNCELQSLAANFGIREQSFRHDALNRRPPVTENKILVRDMGKCVKCGRCVEACQEIQTVRNLNTSHRGIHYEISTPYGQALVDGLCVFCGQCAAVCPVGAIYEHDQSADVWKILNDSERHTAVQITGALGTALDKELGLPPGTFTAGNMVTALKRLGFDKVFDTQISMDAASREESDELLNRIQNKGQLKNRKLPIITGCSPGWNKFAENFYPDLAEHFSTCKNYRQIFATFIKTAYTHAKTTVVSITPCVANKFKYQWPAVNSPACHDVDLLLTVNELAQMFRQNGINFAGLPETPFDVIDEAPKTSIAPCLFKDVHGQRGIQEAEISLGGTSVKLLFVYGLGNVRTVMDSIRKGECDAAFVKIMSCPGTDSHRGLVCGGDLCTSMPKV
jgi:NADH-quinone oxidoreductase subunit G/NADP-reducing hydrogenase subunit HndD